MLQTCCPVTLDPGRSKEVLPFATVLPVKKLVSAQNAV